VTGASVIDGMDAPGRVQVSRAATTPIRTARGRAHRIAVSPNASPAMKIDDQAWRAKGRAVGGTGWI
jgi:hypothetical protein